MRSLFILALLLAQISQAQHVMYPLKVGNRWEYESHGPPPSPPTSSFTMKITGDTILANGKEYAICTTFDSYGTWKRFFREDSDKVFSYWPGDSSECLLYQFNLKRGDSTCQRIFVGENLAPILGRWLKIYWFDEFVPGFGEDVAESLGVIAYYYEIGWSDILTGAVIDGIIYGTVSGISDNRVSNPNVYSLSQNYPNPFNPSTTISYSQAHTGWISLSVYNQLGQRVALLVNEVKYPGGYTCEWTPDGIPSGVYYYQLRSGSYIDTKAMTYIK